MATETKEIFTNLERWMFYPVAIISTVIALQSWSYSEPSVAVPYSSVIALLWLKPLLPVSKQFIVRISLWLSTSVIFIGVTWIFIWR